MQRNKLVKHVQRPATDIIEIHEDAMSSELAQIPHKQKAIDIFTDILRVWCPINRKNQYSRNGSIASSWNVYLELTLSPMDSIKDMLPILEIIERQMGVDFTSSFDGDSYRKFSFYYKGIDISLYVYPTYSNSCTIIETEVPDVKIRRTIVCR